MAGKTSLDPTAVSAMIAKHTGVMTDVEHQIYQAQVVVDQDIAGNNNGAMVSAVQTVLQEWQTDIGKVVSHLGDMIQQLQNTLNQIQSSDQEQGVQIGHIM